MKRWGLTFLWIFVLIFLSYTANAEMIVKHPTDPIVVNTYYPTADFVLSGETEISVCSCETSAHVLTIENIGTVPLVFETETYNQGSELLPKTFTLGVDKSIDITHMIDVPCLTTSDYDITFSLRANNGVDKSFKQALRVSQCSSLSTKASEGKARVTPCEQANYSIGISNTATFPEKYTFSVLNFTGNIALPPPVTVYPRQTVFVETWLTPDCSEYGMKTPEFIIQTENTDERASVPLDLDILPRYDFSIDVDDEIKICKGVVSEIPITLLNKANLTNEYRISVDGPQWAKITTDYLNLTRDELGLTGIRTEPTDETTEELSLVISPRYGFSETRKNITVIVQDCYDYSIQLLEKEACADDPVIDVKIKYGGLFNESLSLSVPEGFSIPQSLFEVSPGTELVIPITLPETKKAKLELVAEISGNVKSLKETIPIYSVEKCYEGKIVDKSLWFTHDAEKRSVVLKNTGYRPAQYKVSAESRDWFFLNQSLYLMNPGDALSIPIFMNASSDIKQGIYPVKFLLHTMGSNITYGDSVSFMLYDYNLFTFLTTFPCAILFMILKIVGIVFLILSFLNKEHAKKNFRAALISFILAAVILLLCFVPIRTAYGIGYSDTVDHHANACPSGLTCEEENYISWEENSVYVLSLSELFIDPDNQTLYISHDGTEHISIEYEGMDATLIPKNGWNGLENVTFTVSDGQGNVTSPIFYLHVLDTGRFSLKNWLLDMYGYILIIIIVLLSLGLFLSRERKEE